VLNEPTMEKLLALKLTAFAAAWGEQHKDAEVAKLSFDERLGLLIDAEWLHRENVRMERYTREAKLRLSGACIEGIDFSAKRELDKSAIRQLATGRWVQEHQSVVITGMTGTGKTYIACALAHAACRKGRCVRLDQGAIGLHHADECECSVQDQPQALLALDDGCLCLLALGYIQDCQQPRGGLP